MQLTIIKTFISRFLILFLSFGLVIFSTNMWGSEGKGTISIVIANAAAVSFFSSIFSGSSTSYFASRFKVEKILLYAYLWSLFIGLFVPFLFSFTSIQSEYLMYLIGISVFSSLLSTNIGLFIGTQNIRKFNTYTVLQQLVHVVFIMLLVYGFGYKDVSVYFMAQIGCLVLLFVTSFFQIIRKCKLSEVSFSKVVSRNMFEYGWKTQLSAFVQFLNYRLSFYFLEYFEGIASVGVFSIGVTFSEAIWTITRSIAVVLYSDVVNSKSREESIAKTKGSLKLTFTLMLVFVAGVIIVPSEVYLFIFGKEFRDTKEIIFFLTPGILGIAVSDMVGHYFSGIRELKILNIKSIVGLVVTVVFSFIAIPRWGILGACFATTSSYLVSSFVLFRKFYHSTPFRWRDYMISRKEIMLLKNKLLKK
ncbi:polysaccharide biosynthesis C-terminal domain-containing protein [Chryseobacterium indologenes]|uniref:oligosaccharide flippase family protein n=1 Tax=Chryseobacterium indologenes TaxID=253 RepID=UPI0003E07755|nr:polysaccharide biosynthesis C-terminal domain-containing protein [Chryseobacterium indologenes]ASE63069.1 teichoic acid transporter [Chryseobacterium indologenes]ATN06976.1 teichoic acid transporter [Chryseobacterium indologenes]AYY84278.1 teichoic acid transporter [Chryseobacterium indologenes]AYZ38021.1 teichoic acid transporter [Chryseobacterium indologenes]MBF6646944.1 polysaccharide biosynthesis C-terminal domain-containing protein [Chryseobacterium indologenes]